MKKILVVEDDKNLRLLFCEILQRENFHVIGVENGSIGLETIKELIFDLVICDVNMPNMNGFEFLTVLRQKSNTMNIPVIMVSANSDYAHQESAFKLGANAYLVKPILSKTLLTTIFELSIL